MLEINENKNINENQSEQLQDEQKNENISPDLKEIKRIIEAVLFVSDKPITIQRIKNLFKESSNNEEIRSQESEVSDLKSEDKTQDILSNQKINSETIRNIINELKEEYNNTERSFQITEIAGGYQIFTRDKYSPWIQKFVHSKYEKKISHSLLENLAIIAYKQPITRLEIEAIRGVGVSSSLKLLMEKKLIRIVGKKEGIGRTFLYGTTKEFLIYFGLNSLDELPQINELKKIMKNDIDSNSDIKDVGISTPSS